MHDTARRWQRPRADRPLPLFDPPANRSATSQAAAAAIAPHVSTVRARVLNFLRERGDTGATNEEIARVLALKESTASSARNHLVEAGLAQISNRTRPTRSGRQAEVITAT
jgi:predicted transcriptional regulator